MSQTTLAAIPPVVVVILAVLIGIFAGSRERAGKAAHDVTVTSEVLDSRWSAVGFRSTRRP
jgi:hypothetical protein